MRKVKDVMGTIGRDAGKVFRITEMPAVQAEKWGFRAFMALTRTGVPIPQNVQDLGIVGVAIVTINTLITSNVKWEELEPLLDEMFTCIKIVRDIKHPDVATDIKDELNDIEEPATRTWLRSEVLELHTGFSVTAALSKLISEITTATASLTMQMSQTPSGSS